MELSKRETNLLLIFAKSRTIESLTRKSDKEFDFTMGGLSPAISYNTKYFAWAPLLAIRELLCWTDPAIARMSDYPEMVEDGDWSGIRDSSKETIWRIFDHWVAIREELNFPVGNTFS